MERLMDKLLLGICCAASAVAFSPNAEAVALLLLACALSLGAEAADSRAGAAPSSRPALLARLPWLSAVLPCAAALALPPLTAFLPLAAYDLVSLGIARSATSPGSAQGPGAGAPGRAATPAAPVPAGTARGNGQPAAPHAAPSPAQAPRMAVPDNLNAAPALACGLIAAMIPWLAAPSAHALAMGQLALTAGLDLAAALLAWRTAVTAAQRARNQRDRDRLSARAQQLAAQNRDLQDRRAYEVRVATLEERARIAREIHDNVGHLLTRACLQVEALRVVHEGNPRAQADFADVGRTLSEALSTVRASVHNLRDDAVDLGAQMHRLAAETTADTGLAVEVEVSADRVPADAATCFLAILREAAANTLRHGNATRLRAQCLEHPAFYQLVVVDNGSGAAGAPTGEKRGTRAAGIPAATGAPAGAGRGMGLASMRERVEALGGSFSAGPQAGGGFRVFASIPKRT